MFSKLLPIIIALLLARLPSGKTADDRHDQSDGYATQLRGRKGRKRPVGGNSSLSILLPPSLMSRRRPKRLAYGNSSKIDATRRHSVNIRAASQTSWPMCNDKRRVSVLNFINSVGESKTPHESVKIVQSIPFNGEPMSLLTIAYLYDVVDYFIVVESLQTFSGINRKDFHLDIQSQFLDPYRDKMIEVRIERFPDWEADMEFYSRRGECVICWFREAYIRNVVKTAIHYAFPNPTPYILVHSDGDELPKRTLMNLLPLLYDKMKSEWNSRANMMTTKFTYNFDWYSPKSWHRSIFLITDIFFQVNFDFR